jgi:hypothetical protein
MDKYAFLWPGWNHYFQRCWDFGIEASVYFATDKSDVRFPGILPIKTGAGEWSDRLSRALDSIEESNVFYLQEDFWPVRTLPKPFFEKAFRFFSRNKLDAFRLISSGNYVLRSTRHFLAWRNVKRFCHRRSLYLVNHQPSFWRKDFLRQCLMPNESPWQNEMAGTERIRPLAPKLCMLKLDWYNEVCRKGRLTAVGEAMMAAIDRTKVEAGTCRDTTQEGMPCGSSFMG